MPDMIQYGIAILMEIGYGEAMRFHLFQAMRFHISQRYAISSVSIHAILMEIGLRVKQLMRIFSRPYFLSKKKPTDFNLRRENQWVFIGDWVHIQLPSHRQVMEYHSECQPLRDATGKTNKKITSDAYSDDDDFVNPPPVTLPVQKLVTKVTRRANSKKVKDSLWKLNIRVENATIKSSRGELIHWTSPMLKDRELEELSTGGFGNVVISSHHTNMNLIEQEEDGTEHEEMTMLMHQKEFVYLLVVILKR
ncbi:hypothetical protein L1887_01003 [Cichorium endivia]|nr:hypothetical protein L1887_01003 [Cichorium endivia]